MFIFRLYTFLFLSLSLSFLLQCLPTDVFSNEIDSPELRAAIDDLNNSDPSIRFSAVMALDRLKSRAGVIPLIAALQDNELNIRKKAAEVLGEMRAPSAVEPLIELLWDNEPAMRIEAISALREIKDIRSIYPVTLLFKDNDPLVRRTAVWFYYVLRDHNALPGLIDALKDNDAGVRRYAAEVLGAYGNEALSAKKSLIEAMKDTDPGVRLEAALTLGNYERNRPVTPFLHLLNDSDPLVRIVALKALGSNSYKDARVLRSMIEILKDPYPQVRVEVIKSLVQYRDSFVLKYLKEMANDKDADVRREAQAAFIKIKEPGLGEEIQESFSVNAIDSGQQTLLELKETLNSKHIEYIISSLYDTSPDIRKQALILAKGYYKVGELTNHIIALLNDRESEIRAQAVTALGDYKRVGIIEDSKGIENIIATLKDEESDVQLRAVAAIGEYGDRRASEPLMSLFKKKFELRGLSHLAEIYLYAIWGVGDPKAAPLIINYIYPNTAELSINILYSLDPWMAEEIALIHLVRNQRVTASSVKNILKRSKNPQLLRFLVKELKHGERNAKRDAVWLLGEMGDTSSLEALGVALNDQDEEVRNEAKISFSKIKYRNRKYFKADQP